MLECKRCESTKVVKNGNVRGKQRYLCKRCGYHFTKENERDAQIAAVHKALCTVFQALDYGKQRLIGSFLKRDPALIYRWMKKTSIDFQGRWDNGIRVCPDIEDLYDELKYSVEDHDLLLADNVINDLYIAVIIQNRKKP